MYRTATAVSSNRQNLEHSVGMTDELLINNGYTSKTLNTIKKAKPDRKRGNIPPAENKATLKVPFLSDKCSASIRRAAEQLQLPIRIVTTPGRKLQHHLTSSRPLDGPRCVPGGCETCKALDGTGKCITRNVVYRVSCGFEECQQNKRGLLCSKRLRELLFHDYHLTISGNRSV